MKPIEALETIGLQAGEEYSEAELLEAAQAAKNRAQILVQRARTVEIQEEAMETLRRLSEAMAVLGGLIRGGTFCVPGSSTVSSPARDSSAPPSGGRRASWGSRLQGFRWFARARKLIGTAIGGGWHSLIALPKSRAVCELAAGLGKLLLAIGLLVKAPFHYAGQRQYVRASLTSIFVLGMAWAMLSFITGGVEDISCKIRGVTRTLNELLVSVVRRDSGSASRDQGVQVTSDVPEDISVEIDGEPIPDLQQIDGGAHDVRIQRKDESLYSGRLCFPHGGRVGVKQRADGGIELTIHWHGGEQWLAFKTQ